MILELFLLASVSAKELTFDQAKAFADRDESSLSSKENGNLIQSQGNVAGPAFANCLKFSENGHPPNFTVVMLLDDSGKAIRTWRKSETQFAKCVETQFSASTFFKPPKSPFYTSFEFTFKP